MRVLSIVHQEDAGPGVFRDAIGAAGAELETWSVSEEPAAPRDPSAYDAAMAFGGAMHPDQDTSHGWLAREREVLSSLLDLKIPLLGICLGAQTLSQVAGGEVRRARRPEIGWFGVELTAEGRAEPVLAPLAPAFEAFLWHSYEFTLPPGATALARSEVCLQAWTRGAATAIQFHAEVAATDARAWIRDYGSDEDAVRLGIEPEPLEAETEAKIGAFNDLGRELCARWLASVPS
jgi:GMP synthase-like glutamine amidotransferase